jgi:hypothetical protein
METCACARHLAVHFKIHGIVNLVTQYSHDLSHNYFKETLQNVSFWVSTNHEGSIHSGKCFGSYFSSASLGIVEFPIHTVNLTDFKIECAKIGLQTHTTAQIEMEEDWYCSLMTSVFPTHRTAIWTRLTQSLDISPAKFHRVCDLMLRTLMEIIDAEDLISIIECPYSRLSLKL